MPKSKSKSKPASKKILKHLEKRGVKFEVVPHRKVFTAYDLAQTAGAKLDEIAKTLLVKVELPQMKKKGQYYVVVMPASYSLDMKKLKKELKAKKAELAPEKVMKRLGLEPGAVSPFGSVRDLGVIMDKSLVKAKQTIVGAESFTESLRMKVKDLIAIEAPIVVSIGKKNTLKLQKKVRARRASTARSAKRAAAAPSKRRKPAKKAALKKPAKRKAAPKRKPAKKSVKKAAPKRKAAVRKAPTKRKPAIKAHKRK
ncbi:MAG: YbaK/EbsC family protein [Patescibacteria group bacterium]|nr:YbaK/EbsC family protein [Patescibacteria group bacterium]